MFFSRAPLHRIYVPAKQVFTVDVVDFIMGNNIAGGKVYPAPDVLWIF